MIKINIESSTYCNAKCTFCPRSDMTRRGGEMSDELFHKIIKEGKEMGVTTYYPFLNGEPFMFPRIWEWLDYMEKEGVTVNLHSNMELCDVDRLLKYKNIGYVNCSLNAINEDTYNKVMRGPDFKNVKKNIDDLLKKAKFKVQVSFVMSEENIGDLAEFQKKYGKKTTASFANWTGDKESKYGKKGKRKPCQTIFQHMYILWDGRVIPCCMDYDGKQIMGDANKQSLQEIWESSKWFRDKHKRYEFDAPICENCNYNL